MAEKQYVCGYTHCLHYGQKILQSEAVAVGSRKYHWDCAAQKQQMERIKNTYFSELNEVTPNKDEENNKFKILGKVLNDLIYKNDLNIDYVEFCVNYYASYKKKFKSPLILRYLNGNKVMERKWNNSKGKVIGC